MFTLKNEPQSSQQVLEQGFALYKHAFTRSAPYAFLAALLMIMPYTLSMLYSATHGMTTHHQISLWIIAIAWLGGFTILSGLIFRLYCICYNVPSHFVGSIVHAVFKLIPLILLLMLYCLIILSGTMLLIIPGLIFTISLMFSFILVITDNQNVLQTLLLSHRLVWGQWWHVACVICIPLLLNIIFTLAILLSSILFLTKMQAMVGDILLTVTVLNIAIQTIFIPLIFSIMLVLLHGLRRQALANLPKW